MVLAKLPAQQPMEQDGAPDKNAGLAVDDSPPGYGLAVQGVHRSECPADGLHANTDQLADPTNSRPT